MALFFHHCSLDFPLLVFERTHTCFCTVKKSFLYAAMPLLNWRLSAAVQLSDPVERQRRRRRGRKKKNAVVSLKHSKTICFHIKCVCGASSSSLPPPLSTHTHTQLDKQRLPCLLLGINHMLQASPTPPPNSPTSLITLTLTILHSHQLTHHGHTLTTAAAAALRQGRGLKVNHCFNDESTKTGAKKKWSKE